MIKKIRIICEHCGKSYPASIYRNNDNNKLVICKCGGTVVSRSGKIFAGVREVDDNKK